MLCGVVRVARFPLCAFLGRAFVPPPPYLHVRPVGNHEDMLCIVWRFLPADTLVFRDLVVAPFASAPLDSSAPSAGAGAVAGAASSATAAVAVPFPLVMPWSGLVKPIDGLRAHIEQLCVKQESWVWRRTNGSAKLKHVQALSSRNTFR